MFLTVLESQDAGARCRVGPLLQLQVAVLIDDLLRPVGMRCQIATSSEVTMHKQSSELQNAYYLADMHCHCDIYSASLFLSCTSGSVNQPPSS